MHLHFSIVFTVFVLTGVAIVLCRFGFLHLRAIGATGVKLFLLALAVLSLRLFLPVEFAFTITIPVSRGLPAFAMLFYTPLAEWAGIRITMEGILGVLWAVVSGILLLRMVYIYRRCRRSLLQAAQPVDAIALMGGIVLDGARKGLSRITVVQAAGIGSPMILGYRKPVIVLPAIHLSPREWSCILAHELNHYRHGDLWIKLALNLVQIIHWWNPCSYILGHLATELLEIRNDKELLAAMSPKARISYYECMLKIAKSRRRLWKNRPGLAFDSPRKNVALRRIRLVGSDVVEPTRHATGKGVIAALMLTLVIGLSFFVVFEPYATPPEDLGNSYVLTADTAYFVARDTWYDIYAMGMPVGKTTSIPDSLQDLKVYTEAEHAALH